MARRDTFAGRKSMFGNNRSHALNATKRRFNLNVQSFTLVIGGKKTRIKTTAKTFRTLKKKNLLS